MLNDPDLSEGGRKYLYSIARIYSTSQMKQLKQDQYHQLLFKELAKGRDRTLPSQWYPLSGVPQSGTRVGMA